LITGLQASSNVRGGVDGRVLWFGCALVLAVAGCDRWLTNPSLYNTVTVVVTTRGGSPIPGAALTLYTGQRPMGYASTGADGRYVFQDVPQGNYGVFAIPPSGYVPIEDLIGGKLTIYKDDLIVSKDTLSPVRFAYLKRGPGALVAMVVEPSGAPIPGAAVTAYSSTAVDSTTTTDSRGVAAFSNVAFGVHGLNVQRPPPYRDFVTPNDSPSVYRDNLIVDAGSTDTVIFRLSRCSGTLTALALDGTGLPVPNATIKLYTSTEQFAQAVTDANGRTSSPKAPCVIQFGVSITPPTGYSVPSGRGSSFFDALTVPKNGAVSVTFHLTKAP
jgi:hypothetical protein